jgi:hypothetical protein
MSRPVFLRLVETYLLRGVGYSLKSWYSLSFSNNSLLSWWKPKVHYRAHESPPYLLTYSLTPSCRIFLNSWYSLSSSTANFLYGKSRDSSVGIALVYGLDDKFSRFRFPEGVGGNFFLQNRVHNGSGVHPASYPMDTRGCFSKGKAAAAWSWPLTSI